MIQVKFQVIFSDTEVTAGGSSYDLIQIKDSVTHRFIGLWYSAAGGLAETGVFQLFDSSGTGHLNIPQTIAANQIEGFTINVFPQADGRQAVHLYHAGVYFGNFTTTDLMTPDSVLAGAVALTHGSGGLLNRVFQGFTIGSSAGAQDIFTDGGYRAGTVSPPWSASSGGFTISGYPALGQGQLWLNNPTGAVAYVVKAFGGGGGGPPPPPPPTPPGPSGLIFVGDSTWKPTGHARWLVNGWELDRCIIPWRGGIDGLDAFLNSFAIWSLCGVDPNLYLESYPVDEHKQFPTVNLTFLGKKGGHLPPDRNEAASSIQQTSGIVFSDAFILTFGLPPHWTARITYISPMSRFVTWGRTPPNFDSISAPAPPDITASSIVSLVLGGVDYTVWPAAAANYGSIVNWVLRWFMQRTARYTSSQELVPGQYYRAEVTTQVLLLPIQEEIVG